MLDYISIFYVIEEFKEYIFKFLYDINFDIYFLLYCFKNLNLKKSIQYCIFFNLEINYVLFMEIYVYFLVEKIEIIFFYLFLLYYMKKQTI